MAEFNPNNSPIENFKIIRLDIDSLQGKAIALESELKGLPVRYNSTPTTEENASIAHAVAFAVGSYVTISKSIVKISDSVTELSSKLSKYLQYSVQFLKNEVEQALKNIAQWIIKEIEKLALRLKQIVLTIKIKVTNLLKGTLTSVAVGKASAAAVGVATALLPIFTKFQVLSNLLNTVLTAIDTFLKAIPPVISVEPAAMAFFMTPKSLKKVDIVAVNPNQSIADRLTSAAKEGLALIVKETDKLNIPVKQIGIAASSAAAVAEVAAPGNGFTGAYCKVVNALNILDVDKMLKLVDKVLQLLPIPLAMPKYENLRITNLGFLTWLFTSFELAGRQSFGIPGQP